MKEPWDVVVNYAGATIVSNKARPMTVESQIELERARQEIVAMLLESRQCDSRT